MRDLAIRLKNQPGALAAMGETLGKAGVSIEGGGGFVVADEGLMHFLFADATAARSALLSAGIEVLEDRDVITVRLDQETPGQMGSLARALAEAQSNIEVVYSDHDNQLILVTDNNQTGAQAAANWKAAQLAGLKLRDHHYKVRIQWTGNTGQGTSGYTDYGRDHTIEARGKPTIAGSSDPQFRGDAQRWNPEEMLVASLSSCHQLWYLHLCSDAGVIVTSYVDDAEGILQERAGGRGRFSRVVLRPTVGISAASSAELATALHEKAHAMCYIARSVNFPVACEPNIVIDAA